MYDFAELVKQRQNQSSNEQLAKRVVDLEFEVRELKKIIAEYLVKPAPPLVHHCSSSFNPVSPPSGI